MEIMSNQIQGDLRPTYDFVVDSLDDQNNSRALIFNEINHQDRVLDIGCDTGRFGEILTEKKHCLVDGIEPCSAAADSARKRLNQVFNCSISDDILSEIVDLYDCVLFLDVLEHLVDPWSSLRFAKNCLRPGGKLCVVVPNVAHISIIRRLLMGEFEYTQHGTMDRTHLRWFTRKSLGNLFVETGFSNVKVTGVPLLPYIGKDNLLSNVLLKSFPDVFSGSLVCVGLK